MYISEPKIGSQSQLQYIFTNKMQYQRSPFRQKQNNYDYPTTPKKTTHRNQDTFYNDKENPHRTQINLNHKNQSALRNTFLESNPKHITSQIINEYDNQFNDKPQKSYKRQNTLDLDFDPHNKSHFQENKKFNAKHFEIESKISKIQSFHQKIQTLLDMVNKKPKTPNKIKDSSSHLTPQKPPTYQLSSRSVTKVSPLNLRQKNPTQNPSRECISRELNERRQFRQQKYVQQNPPSYYNKKNIEQFDQISSNQQEEFNCNNGRPTSKFNDATSRNKSQNQFKRQSKYFAKEKKGPSIRASDQFKESNRKKSKQYMKSIEGEVRDIQNTIELLNKKIKQVDTISSFKKQIAFDNISTGNPESLSDNQQRVASEMQKIYKPSRTPTRLHKQTEVRNSPPSKYMRYRQSESTKNISCSKNEGSFRKSSINGVNTPSRKEYNLQVQGCRKEDSDFRREAIKISSPYDGDVEQSDQRSRQMMRDLRPKKN